jgi:serine-type D-Ala-D-Ala carboxypeptidase (penicillin-binding protein 5/6)
MSDTSKHPIPLWLLILDAVLIVLIIWILIVLSGNLNRPKRDTSPGTLVRESTATSTAFAGVRIQAKAAYVYDVASNTVIYQKNGSAQLPLASLTKLMMALVAADLLPRDSHITIRKEFLAEEGDNGLLPNESWRLKDLLDFSLVMSSNDGARSIASVVGAEGLKTADYDLGRKEFISKMNERAQELDLTQTYFINESGLDEGMVSGGYGSAENVARLMKYILASHPELLEATTHPALAISSFDKKHVAINTNTDVRSIPGLLASKTGFTDLAGGNLTVAFDTSMEHPIIVVVLGSTEEGRFADVKALVDAGVRYTQD